MERRILFVEDDASFRELFARAMREALATEQLDVAFVEAGTLAEARARLREGGLDAALIDITLPDGNGLELVEEIKDGGAGRHIPTLVLTVTLDTSVAARAVEGGALQASFGARDRCCDKEANLRRRRVNKERSSFGGPPAHQEGDHKGEQNAPPRARGRNTANLRECPSSKHSGD